MALMVDFGSLLVGLLVLLVSFSETSPYCGIGCYVVCVGCVGCCCLLCCCCCVFVLFINIVVFCCNGLVVVVLAMATWCRGVLLLLGSYC